MDKEYEDAKAYRPHPIRYVRRIIAAAFGVTAERCSVIVSDMLRASLAESVGYWFQLVLSMAIATLGLVLNSSGVVIAAMLIAPLMGPIVQIGMALAIGSPVLAIRASMRAIISIVVVVGSATLITMVLPFYEVTPEIAARTSPTVLDLIIAGCHSGRVCLWVASPSASGCGLMPPSTSVTWNGGQRASRPECRRRLQGESSDRAW